MRRKADWTKVPGITIFFFFLFLVLPRAACTAELCDGYDENTEMTIRGTVSDVIKEARGPVIVIVAGGEKNYNLVTAPAWYLKKQNIGFAIGGALEVTGSRVLAEDGVFYLITRRLREIGTGKTIELRDDHLKPIWRGKRWE